MPARILIVEDNPGFAFGLKSNHEFDDYRVEVVEDGRVAVRLLEKERFDLIILDLMLPGMNGVEVLARIRGMGLDTPVVVVTALHEQIFWLRALKVGADKYFTKPLPSLVVFLAEIEALLRQRERLAMSPAQVVAAVEEYGTGVPIDPTGGRGLYFGGRFIGPESTHRDDGDDLVHLTLKERQLLVYLMLRPRQVISPEELLREIWGLEPRMRIKTGVLKDTIFRLRRKLEKDPKHPRHIRTARGGGYFFDP